jgi:hypothetical protein
VNDAPCADIARAQGESLHATASIVHSWVLLEQPGPWGRDAVNDSRLPPAVAAALEQQSTEHRFRLLLLRHTGPETAHRRRCFVAHSGRAAPWIVEGTIDDPAALLDVDFAGLRQGKPPGFGAPRSTPLYLICTNGRHDPCCARFGRPIVRALAGRFGDSVWECSHVGGDRFAGNLVCLPHALYFGGLGPEEARRVTERYAEGRIDLDHYRGRAGDPYAVQAAEFFVRRRADLDGVDDVVPVWYGKLRTGVVQVELEGPSERRFEVQVGIAPAAARKLTCSSTSSEHPLAFTLLALRDL